MRNRHAFLLILSGLLVINLVPTVSLGQDLVFSMAGQINDTYLTGDHSFGFMDGALVGMDPMDTPEPPLPPGSYFAMAFTMIDSQFPTQTRWRDDFRSPGDFADGLETWEMVFSTDQPDEVGTISLGLVSGTSDSLQIRLVRPEGSTELTIPGEFTVSAEEMGEVFVIEIRSSQNLVSEISFDQIKCLFR